MELGKQALEVGQGSNRIITGELPWVHGEEAASRVGPSDLHLRTLLPMDSEHLWGRWLHS